MTLSPVDSPLAKWGFSEWLAACTVSGEAYQVPELDDVNDAVIRMDGKEVVNFAGIGILGWQHDPQVRRVFAESAEAYGLAVGGSRMVQGVSRPHLELESLLAEVTGKESALTFGTGMLANVGFVNAMAARFSFNDRPGVDNSDMVFVLDRDSHWSMWKAAEKAELGRQLVTFRHNDTAHLRQVLHKHRGKRLVVGFETVYSADGTIAPVGEILDLCEEYEAVSYADDANGFLVYGHGERRFAQQYEDLSRVTFRMVTFSKSIGLSGGAVAGPADAMEAFQYLSGTSMFTANVQPPTASAVSHVMRRMLQDPSVMGGYLDRIDRMRERLIAIGCVINETPTYVTSISVGSDDIAVRVRQDFLDRGYLVPMFRYPAVKKNRAVIRLLLNNRLSEDHLEGFIGTLSELKQKYGF
jgi:8-amino-7-oxononanoate synthase